MEKEWLEFGHKFADRCGQGTASDDVNERCPVFLQWLDCVHQLLRQFPCSFQFNETFLVIECFSFRSSKPPVFLARPVIIVENRLVKTKE